MNNFDNLFEDNEYNFDPENHKEIKSRVWQTLGTYRFVGQIVDVYLPTMVNVLVQFAGGNTKGDALSDNDSAAIGEVPNFKPPL